MYGNTIQEVKENRSYYGNTRRPAPGPTAPTRLWFVADAVPELQDGRHRGVDPPSMVWSEVEPLTTPSSSAIRTTPSSWREPNRRRRDAPGHRRRGGGAPPLCSPAQQPASMEAVESSSRMPCDMECCVDAAGNTYDFGFGMNWSGVIQDERTEKYCVEPLTAP